MSRNAHEPGAFTVAVCGMMCSSGLLRGRLPIARNAWPMHGASPAVLRASVSMLTLVDGGLA